MLMNITVPDNEGGEEVVAVPAAWHICEDCRGSGGSSAHIGAITGEQWANDWDEQERDDYMAGRYDKPCGACGGSGKVLLPDLDQCTRGEQRAAVEYLRSEIERKEQENYEDARTYRMESGGLDY